jgi:SAM-dependent methyltransferase
MYNKNMKKITLPKLSKVNFCRICKSKNITKLEIIKSFYLSNFDLNIDIPYACCNDCNFIFQMMYVGDDFLNYYYLKSPMLRRDKLTKEDIDQSKRCYDFFTKSYKLTNKTKILEIGPGNGALLRYIYKKDKSKLYFSDLSKEASNVLESIKGLNNFNKSKINNFDLIIMRHLLEHIHDYDKFFLYLRKRLKKKSKLFIEVPDWSILDLHTDPLIFEHLSQFNVYNLCKLLTKNNFQIESLEKDIVVDDPSSPNRIVRVVAEFVDVPFFKNQFVDFFKKFYSNTSANWIDNLNKILNKFKKKKVALYPSSTLTFEAIKNSDFSNVTVTGIYDIDKKKQNKKNLGYSVYDPLKLKKDDPDLILTFSMAYEPEIRRLLERMKLRAKIISIQNLIENNMLK